MFSDSYEDEVLGKITPDALNELCRPKAETTQSERDEEHNEQSWPSSLEEQYQEY